MSSTDLHQMEVCDSSNDYANENKKNKEKKNNHNKIMSFIYECYLLARNP